MKVDDLLKKHIVTPEFHCVAMKPNAGSLRLLDAGDIQFVYAKGSSPYNQEELHTLDEYLKITDCAHSEIVSTKNIEMLMQYLKLAESAQLKDGKRHLDAHGIQDICYKYGFPIVQRLYIEDKGLLLGFSINSFIERLNNLYICYALWKALQVPDYDLIKQVWPHPLTKDEMQIEFERRLQAYITLHVVYKNNKPLLLYDAENNMELVEAQLAVLASMGDNYLDGGCIAFCADCGQPYTKFRSNSTLCENCKGNTGKSRRRRARRKAEKKGDQNNG